MSSNTTKSTKSTTPIKKQLPDECAENLRQSLVEANPRDFQETTLMCLAQYFGTDNIKFRHVKESEKVKLEIVVNEDKYWTFL